jgi:hypothetical protein
MSRRSPYDGPNYPDASALEIRRQIRRHRLKPVAHDDLQASEGS